MHVSLDILVLFVYMNKNQEVLTKDAIMFRVFAGLRSVTLLNKRLRRRCFPVNFAKFVKTPFLQDTSGRLLLYHA